MIKVIRETGCTPVQRNTFYEPIKVLADGAPSSNEADPPSGKSKVLEDILATMRAISVIIGAFITPISQKQRCYRGYDCDWANYCGDRACELPIDRAHPSKFLAKGRRIESHGIHFFLFVISGWFFL